MQNSNFPVRKRNRKSVWVVLYVNVCMHRMGFLSSFILSTCLLSFFKVIPYPPLLLSLCLLSSAGYSHHNNTSDHNPLSLLPPPIPTTTVISLSVNFANFPQTFPSRKSSSLALVISIITKRNQVSYGWRYKKTSIPKENSAAPYLKADKKNNSVACLLKWR